MKNMIKDFASGFMIDSFPFLLIKRKHMFFYELVKKLHDIFNLEYHETKDGNRAYDKVVGFVELHKEYKPAFDSIYN